MGGKKPRVIVAEFFTPTPHKGRFFDGETVYTRVAGVYLPPLGGGVADQAAWARVSLENEALMKNLPLKGWALGG